MDFWEDDEGVAYVSCDLLLVGDYGGAGAVGEANIRALTDTEGAVERHGAYYSRQLWLPDTEENRAILEDLERDYPLVDDEVHSQVEMEWEEEAWDSYGKADLLRGLPDGLDEIAEGDLTDADLWECYKSAMESTNSYPRMEYSGAALPLDRIQEAFTDAVLVKLQELA